MNKPVTVTAAYRLAVASRALAAAVGGYVLAWFATIVLSLAWPAPKAQAVMWATMISFLVYALAVIWVFATRSAARAWAGMLGASAVLALLAWLLAKAGAA